MFKVLDNNNDDEKHTNRYKFLKPALEILECREQGKTLEEITSTYADFAKTYPRIFTLICTKTTTRMEIIKMVPYIANE